MLIVWPVAQRATTAANSANGIFKTTIKALRQSRKKQQDHQARQQRAEKTFGREIPNGGGNIAGLIEFQPDIDIFRNGSLELRDCCLDAIDYRKSRSVRTFGNWNVYRSLSIDVRVSSNDVGAILNGCRYPGDRSTFRLQDESACSAIPPDCRRESR